MIVTVLRDDKQAAAGESGCTIKCPVGVSIDLKEVLVRSTNFTMPFSRFWVTFYDPSKSTSRKPVSRGTMLNPYLDGAVLFRGRTEWPKGWTLAVRAITQTALTLLQFTIVYEIIEDPKRRPRWGE